MVYQMNKIKKQIILFIIIIVIGACYTINEYIITPKKLQIEQKANELQADKEKLELLKSKSSEVAKLKEEVAKLKEVADSIGDVTVKDIDTPQLVFDFYSSCTVYGIQGDDLIFQLADSSASVETTPSRTSSDGTTVKTETNTTTNKTEDTNNAESTTDLLKFTIDLKVIGDKNKVEKYIRSLNTLTARKINVVSIKLESAQGRTANNNATNTQGSTNTEIIANTTLLTADIVFNQYIYSNGENIIHPSKYTFYEENIGFSNFSDMFK